VEYIIHSSLKVRVNNLSKIIRVITETSVGLLLLFIFSLDTIFQRGFALSLGSKQRWVLSPPPASIQIDGAWKWSLVVEHVLCICNGFHPQHHTDLRLGCIPFFKIFLLVVLGVELRALCLLGRGSVISTTSPSPYLLLVIFQVWYLAFAWGWLQIEILLPKFSYIAGMTVLYPHAWLTGWDGGLYNLLPRLALNCDPPNLCLLGSWVYRCESQTWPNFPFLIFTKSPCGRKDIGLYSHMTGELTVWLRWEVWKEERRNLICFKSRLRWEPMLLGSEVVNILSCHPASPCVC
jgi:hypothetical protein